MSATENPLSSPTPQPPTGAASRRAGPFVNRNFALLWSGLAVSILGDVLFATTLVIWVYELARGMTWAPLAVSGAVLAGALPMVLVGPFAGVFVDRWDKRATLLRMDAARALLIGALLPVAWGLPLPWLPASIAPGGQLPLLWRLAAIYGIVALVSICDQFYRPATVALIGDLVEEPRRAGAMALTQVSGSLAMLIGPAVAAPLAVAAGPQWALLCDALSFVISFATAARIVAPRAAHSVAPGHAGHFLREFGQGLRFMLGNRILRTVLIAGLIAMLGAGATNALDIFFATRNLHVPLAQYGLVGAAQGAGALIGAILIGALARRLGLTRVFAWCVALVGVLLIVFARMTSLIPGLVALFFVGAAAAGIFVATGPLLLRVTPRELVGRVTALLDLVLAVASLVGTAVAGYLYSGLLRDFHAAPWGVRLGPVDTIYAVAGLLVVLGGLYAVLRLRGAERRTGAGSGTDTHMAAQSLERAPERDLAPEAEADAVGAGERVS